MNTTATLRLDDEAVFIIKQILKRKGIKPTNQNALDYAFKITVNAYDIFDEQSISLIEPTSF